MPVLRVLLASVFGGLLLLTAVAWWWTPAPRRDGKTPLVWVSDDNPERQRQIREFNRLFDDRHLTLDPNNTGLQKVIVQCSSGVGPDIADSHFGGQLQTLVNSGIAWDVTEAAREMGFSMADSLWPAVVREVSEEGRQYSYPCNVSVDILMYNRNIFDRLGVPYPQAGMTWDEFMALAQRVTTHKRSHRETIYGVTGLRYPCFFAALGGEYFSEDGTRLLLTEEPLRTAFQMHHDAVFRYRIMPTALDMRTMASQGGWGTGAINLFADGRFAMLVSGKWVLIRLRGAHADQTKKLQRWTARGGAPEAERPAVLRLGSVPLPHMAGHPPRYLVRSRSAVINQRSPRRQAALAFLQYLASPEYSRLINEGVDSLPGNPRYASLGIREGVPDLAESEMHRHTVDSMAFGRVFRRSPFLLEWDVTRVLDGQVGRMESNPAIPVADLLRAAQEELIALMQRNLNRDASLRRRYRELTGTDNVAEAHRRRS